MDTTSAIMLMAIFAIGIVGNLSVLIVFLRMRRNWSATIIYWFNLAIADALFLTTLPAFAWFYWTDEWAFGSFVCKATSTVGQLNMYATVFFLTAISVVRWRAVVRCAEMARAPSRASVRFVCAGVWCAAFALSIPQLLYRQVRQIPARPPDTGDIASVNSSTRTVCQFFYPMTQPPEKKVYVMGALEMIPVVVGFVVPVIVICACYVQISLAVRRSVISRRERSNRVATVSAIIIVAFVLCWFPLHAVTFYSATGGWWHLYGFSRPLYHRWMPIATWLAHINSCVNPFIYAFTSSNFRATVGDVSGNKRRATSNRSAQGTAATMMADLRRKSTESKYDSQVAEGTHEAQNTNVLLQATDNACVVHLASDVSNDVTTFTHDVATAQV